MAENKNMQKPATEVTPSAESLKWMPIDKIADHIQELVDLGMNYRQIAERAGILPSRCHYIMERKIKKIRRSSGEALLAVKYTHTFDDDERYLIWPYQRRVGALMRIGWAGTDIAKEAGLSQATLNQLFLGRKRRVNPAQALGVQLAYEKLHQTPGQRHQSKLIARSAGWPPPEAYEEGELDDLEPTRTQLVFARWEKSHPPTPGEQLYDLIEKNDYTVQEFAAAVGVHYDVLRSWYSEIVKPRRMYYNKMCALLHVEELPIKMATSGPRPQARKRPQGDVSAG